jgi:DNA-binding IclR family transcriptional regulator
MDKLNSQERIVEAVKQLAQAHTEGIANKSLAHRVGTSEANICRDIAMLERTGWVVRGRDGRWRLSPAFGGLAGQIMRAYQEARLRLTEDEARYASAMQ